jgi:tRNA pseudouridine13 synthase
LKDRRAVAVQWFTVPRSQVQTLESWVGVRHPEFDVVEAHAHSRKLPRGALAGNVFTIRVRDIDVDADLMSSRVAEIARRGVPNYFGPQRFGRDGSNLARIADGLRALRHPERGFVLSAARSLVFNAVLASRVGDGTWEQLEVGDIANLDGRGSIFPVDAVDATLIERCRVLDIHPTGALWGRGPVATGGRVAELETRVAAEFPEACALVLEAAMAQERRALRLAVRDFTCVAEFSSSLVLRFRLTRGSFATTVLRELIDSETPADDERDET